MFTSQLGKLWFVLCCLPLCLYHNAMSYIITVLEGQTECVYEEFSNDLLLPGELEDTVPTEVSLGFMVKSIKKSRGRFDPKVDFVVKGPHGDVITEKKNVYDQDVKFFAQGVGSYSLCLTSVIVPASLPEFHKAKVDIMYFTPLHMIDDPGVIFTPHGNEEIRGDQILDTESLSVAHKLVLDMKQKISLILQEQKYLKLREARHQETVKSTNSRSLFWALIVFFAFALANCLQVYFVRRFFNTAR
mmetsp:Transcript_5419/g.7326  ORF Transcript_5419/g.7326 Transcript_5419/m.7326 type:complete len:245 (+) Transcript_5419:170-904(+)